MNRLVSPLSLSTSFLLQPSARSIWQMRSSSPQELPSDNHAVVVVLESAQMSMPEIDTSPLTHETIVYTQTAKDDVAARIQNASVVPHDHLSCDS